MAVHHGGNRSALQTFLQCTALSAVLAGVSGICSSVPLSSPVVMCLLGALGEGWNLKKTDEVSPDFLEKLPP